MALQRIDGSMIGEVEDPRSGFQLIRRAHIHKYFRDNQIEYNPIMNMQHLISICEVRNITPQMIAEHILGPGVLDTKAYEQENRIKMLEDLVAQLAKANGIDPDKLVDEITPEPEQPVDYKDMEMSSLRKMCTTLGIKMERTDTKESLIEKLEAHGKDAFELDERNPETSDTAEAGRAFRVPV